MESLTILLLFVLVIMAVAWLARILKNRLPTGVSIGNILSSYVKFLTSVGEVASSKLDPEPEFIEKGNIRANFSSFWSMDSSTKDLKLLTGEIWIKNSSDQMISVGQVTASSSAGTVKALSPPEVETALKDAPLLAMYGRPDQREMIRATLANSGRIAAMLPEMAYIGGQTVARNQTGKFTACFLIPKSAPREWTLRIENIGSVVLKESLPEID